MREFEVQFLVRVGVTAPHISVASNQTHIRVKAVGPDGQDPMLRSRGSSPSVGMTMATCVNNGAATGQIGDHGEELPAQKDWEH